MQAADLPDDALSDGFASPITRVTGVFDLAAVKYASCYCEENIYCMVRDHVPPERRDEFYVVFISNDEKCVALSFQKASPAPSVPVYWDYHVILLHHRRTHPRALAVYDLDTTLPFGLDHGSYLERTLAPHPALPPRRFRVVPAPTYVRRFASSRAHMKRHTDGGGGGGGWSWIAPPPPWECVVCDEGADTLGRFLDFRDGAGGDDGFGRVYGERAFLDLVEGMAGGAVDHVA